MSSACINKSSNLLLTVHTHRCDVIDSYARSVWLKYFDEYYITQTYSIFPCVCSLIDAHVTSQRGENKIIRHETKSKSQITRQNDDLGRPTPLLPLFEIICLIRGPYDIYFT